MVLRHRSDMVCRQAVELVTDYLEGGLTGADRRRFERHLADCEHCAEYLAQIRANVDLAGHVDADELTPDARAAVSELYRRWRSDG